MHRWLDPNVGRWISEDPIGFAAGDANLYRYVANAPTVYIDPYGLQTKANNPYGVCLLKLPHPPIIIKGPAAGTINPGEGETAINIFGEGENPDLEDWSTDPGYDDPDAGPDDDGDGKPDFDGPKPKRPNTSTLEDDSVDRVVIRSSPVYPITANEVVRIVRPGGTVTVSGDPSEIRRARTNLRATGEVAEEGPLLNTPVAVMGSGSLAPGTQSQTFWVRCCGTRGRNVFLSAHSSD